MAGLPIIVQRRTSWNLCRCWTALGPSLSTSGETLTLASFHKGRAPRNKGLRYPPDQPTVEEIVAVMLAAGDDPEGLRLRGVIIVLWRVGLRISEATTR
jgi:hypothetical protein